MSHLKTPRLVADRILKDSAFPVYYRVYVYLSIHSDWETGIVHNGLKPASVAAAIASTRESVYRAVRKLRTLGWLVDGQGLRGRLAGFASGKVRVQHPPVSIASSNGAAPGSTKKSRTQHIKETLEFSDRVQAMVNRH